MDRFEKSVADFEYDFDLKFSEVPLPEKLHEMYDLLLEDYSTTQESANSIFCVLVTMHFLNTALFNKRNGITDTFDYRIIIPIYEASFLWESAAEDKVTLKEALIKFRLNIPSWIEKMNLTFKAPE
uniref:hypothetical protein n=1 Tax=Polynucleobacter sp. TaxID=2029855 RepID=UPI0040487F98